MATEEVGVRLSVKGRREAAKALRDTAGDVDRIGDRADRSSRALDRASRAGATFGRGIARGAAIGGAALLALGYGTARLASGWITDAKESARIGRLTEAVLKSTGGAANVTADQVGKLAERISNKTAVDDESIQSAANLLLTFTKVRNEVGKGNDVFDRATQAAVDMSAALGVDANAAALQLGKALNDPIKGVTALGRAGVSFTKQQKDQIRTLVESGRTLDAQKVILGEMAVQFGGAAEAAADPIDRLRVIVGNLGERVGGMLLPHVERFANYLADRAVPRVSRFLDQFDRGVGAGGRFRDRLEELRAKGVQLWEEFRNGTGTGGQLRDAFQTVGDAAGIVGALLRDVVVPAMAWLNDHPNALKGIVAGMLALKIHAQGVAAAALVMQGAGLLGLGGGDKDGKGKKGGKGKLPIVGFGGPLGIAAGVAGTLAVNEWMSQTDAPKPGAKPNVTGERIGGPTGPKLYPAVPTQPRAQVDQGGTGRRYGDDSRPVLAQLVLPDGKVLAETMLDGLYTTQARK